MKVYCELCDSDDIPETEGLQVSPGVWIGGDTTVHDHLSLWHPGVTVECDTTDLERVILRADSRA